MTVDLDEAEISLLIQGLQQLSGRRAAAGLPADDVDRLAERLEDAKRAAGSPPTGNNPGTPGANKG